PSTPLQMPCLRFGRLCKVHFLRYYPDNRLVAWQPQGTLKWSCMNFFVIWSTRWLCAWRMRRVRMMIGDAAGLRSRQSLIFDESLIALCCNFYSYHASRLSIYLMKFLKILALSIALL